MGWLTFDTLVSRHREVGVETKSAHSSNRRSLFQRVLSFFRRAERLVVVITALVSAVVSLVALFISLWTWIIVTSDPCEGVSATIASSRDRRSEVGVAGKADVSGKCRHIVLASHTEAWVIEDTVPIQKDGKWWARVRIKSRTRHFEKTLYAFATADPGDFPQDHQLASLPSARVGRVSVPYTVSVGDNR